MNILLINHYAGSGKHGMEYRPFHLAGKWAKLGHNVTIAAASFSHLRSKNPDVSGLVTKEMIEGVQYIWLKTPKYKGNGFRRVLNILIFVFLLLLIGMKLAKSCRPDVVIASSTYPLDIYPASFIAKRVRAKLLFEVHDLWPLSPIELGGVSPRHPFILIMQRAENHAYRVSDSVVSLLPKADSYMREHGMAAHKFVYLPNGIDPVEWRHSRMPLPELHSTVLSGLRQKGIFVVGYTGAHGLANALNSFVEAALSLRNHPVALVLVGQGTEKELLQKRALELGLTGVFFLPPVPRPAVPPLLDLMDALYIGLQKKSIFRFGVSPNKLMDYMMAGKPVIYAVEAGNNPVAESGCGISVAPENPLAIAKAVIQLMKVGSGEREVMGLKGRDYVLKNHDYTVLAQRFLEIMK
jgi:glycosyltransferase involved in cell wall biosynthesis